VANLRWPCEAICPRCLLALTTNLATRTTIGVMHTSEQFKCLTLICGVGVMIISNWHLIIK
jgi:hypothetical protein